MISAPASNNHQQPHYMLLGLQAFNGMVFCRLRVERPVWCCWVRAHSGA